MALQRVAGDQEVVDCEVFMNCEHFPWECHCDRRAPERKAERWRRICVTLTVAAIVAITFAFTYVAANGQEQAPYGPAPGYSAPNGASQPGPAFEEPSCQAWEPPLGSVYITRNWDERLNDSPGWWNHLAIYVGNGYVVEAQVGYGALQTPLDQFLHRPYQAGILYPRDPATGARAAAIAATYPGRPYRRFSSIAPQLLPPLVPRLLHGTADGMNCVAVVRQAYEGATGYSLRGLRRPDHICQRGYLFTNQPPMGAPQP